MALSDCDELAEVGKLCKRHADELLGVRVGLSHIPHAGQGLFTTWPRRRGEHVSATW